MNREEAIREAKGHLEDYLQGIGINTRENFYCLNPSHGSQQGHTGKKDMSYHRASNRVVCHCGAQWDLLDLMQNVEGARDFNEALEMACRRFNIPLEEGEKRIKSTQKKEVRSMGGSYGKEIALAQSKLEDTRALEYLNKRGISLQTAKSHGVGFVDSFSTKNEATGEYEKWEALLFPTGQGGYTVRNINGNDPGNKVRKRGEAGLFNGGALEGAADVVHVVEGEVDALSVLEAGGQAVALASAGQWKHFVDVVSRFKTPFNKTLILSLDNDKAGVEMQGKLYRALKDLQEEEPRIFKGMKVFEVDIAPGMKDPNEALLADSEAFAKRLTLRVSEEAVEAYRNTSAATALLNFYEGVAEGANTPVTPTGFYSLDKQLDGGFYEGLYTIPAISSLGKTTFALQLAEAIAAQGKDVLYFSLEMSTNELIAKSLSRHTFLQTVERDINRLYAKTVRGITDYRRYKFYDDTERELISGAYERYNEYASHIFFCEGMGDIGAKDIRARVEQHRTFTGETPVVFVDYLQILAPADPRSTDKQNMDKAALEMKRLSRDFKTPVIVLSSVNRLNYHEAISLEAIKESGGIEYGSDVVIGLQLEGAGTAKPGAQKEWIKEKMQEDPRRVEAVILKNRNGARGAQLPFSYYPKFNYFHEEKSV